MRFDSYHPTINALFFAAMLAAALSFDHPVFLLIGWGCAFSYAVALEGRRALKLGLLLIPAAVLFALYYAYYHHFGLTNLAVNFIGNRITLESLCFGLVLGMKAATVILWFVCIHAVISDDKIVYLLGRAAPRASMYLAILLRTVPRIRQRFAAVEQARQSVGRGRRQGSLLRRCGNLLRELSIVITWTLDDFIGSSGSMKSRGSGLRGRTAFSIFRFDNRDRLLVIVLFALLTLLGSAVLLDQTRALYSPILLINPVTPLSCVFYAGYALLGLLPLLLQSFGERRLRRLTAGLCGV